MKKGRHRRYEEARKFKRSHEDNLHEFIESFNVNDEYEKPEHAAWAEEFAQAETERHLSQPAPAEENQDSEDRDQAGSL